LARIPGGIEPTRATQLERIVSGWQFRSGEKRGSKVGKTKRGKGTKWMVVVDGEGVPLGKQLYSASPNEVRLAEETLASICVTRRHRAGRPREKAQRVIADRAYDSDPLRGRKMVGRCAVTGAAGRLNEPWRVSATFADWSFATTVPLLFMKLSFISPAS
jgi:hypothetical protein